MEFEINRIRTLIWNALTVYNNVEFEYCNANEAMRKALGLKEETFDFEIQINHGVSNFCLSIETNNKIFGPQPFFALKLKDGRYIWDNLDFAIFGKKWSYTFDSNTVDLNNVDTIGVASCNDYGFVRVVTLDNSGNVTNNACYV